MIKRETYRQVTVALSADPVVKLHLIIINSKNYMDVDKESNNTSKRL